MRELRGAVCTSHTCPSALPLRRAILRVPPYRSQIVGAPVYGPTRSHELLTLAVAACSGSATSEEQMKTGTP